MVSQTSRCLQFHPARITNIENNMFSVIYLTTKALEVIPGKEQIQSLVQVGRGTKLCSVRTLLKIDQEGSTKLVHTSVDNKNNVTSLYKISLVRWKRQRKYQVWCKEGKVAANNTVYYCVPVSLIVLWVFRTPHEAMRYLNSAASTVKRGTLA